jgi:hypothetical protein
MRRGVTAQRDALRERLNSVVARRNDVGVDVDEPRLGQQRKPPGSPLPRCVDG